MTPRTPSTITEQPPCPRTLKRSALISLMHRLHVALLLLSTYIALLIYLSTACTYIETSTNSTPTSLGLDHFIAYALHRTRVLPPSLSSPWIFSKLETRFLAAKSSPRIRGQHHPPLPPPMLSSSFRSMPGNASLSRLTPVSPI